MRVGKTMSAMTSHCHTAREAQLTGRCAAVGELNPTARGTPVDGTEAKTHTRAGPTPPRQ